MGLKDRDTDLTKFRFVGSDILSHQSSAVCISVFGSIIADAVAHTSERRIGISLFLLCDRKHGDSSDLSNRFRNK